MACDPHENKDTAKQEEHGMKNVNWKIRLKAAGHKAAKAAAQTVTAAIGTAAAIGKVNWVAVGSAAVVSILLSLMNSAVSPEEEED